MCREVCVGIDWNSVAVCDEIGESVAMISEMAEPVGEGCVDAGRGHAT